MALVALLLLVVVGIVINALSDGKPEAPTTPRASRQSNDTSGFDPRQQQQQERRSESPQQRSLHDFAPTGSRTRQAPPSTLANKRAESIREAQTGTCDRLPSTELSSLLTRKALQHDRHCDDELAEPNISHSYASRAAKPTRAAPASRARNTTPEPAQASSDEEEEPEIGEEHCERLRQQAEYESRRMDRAFKDATRANQQGNGEAARKFVQQGYYYQGRMNDFKRQAADLIFKIKNASRSEDTIDLHGLTVAEALVRVEGFISKAARQGYSQVKIITGKGNHSEDFRAKIKPNVAKLMREKGYDVWEHPHNAGLLLVDLI